MQPIQLGSKAMINKLSKIMKTDPSQKLFKNASQHIKLDRLSKLKRNIPVSILQHSKILPKNILYDKQSLYLEVLDLKIVLNRALDENIKLKTKIMGLESEAQRNRKTDYEQKQEYSIRKQKDGKRNEIVTIEGLKRALKQTKVQMQTQKRQIQSMKKLSKISKMNQLQIENQLVINQNKELSQKYEQACIRLEEFYQIRQKKEQLEKGHEALTNQIKRLEHQIKQLHSYILTINLEKKTKKQYTDTYLVKDKKLLKDLMADKRRNDGQHHMLELRKQILGPRDSSLKFNKTEQKIIRPNYFLKQMQPIRKQPIISPELNDSKILSKTIQEENARLKKMVQETQDKLKKTEKLLHTFRQQYEHNKDAVKKQVSQQVLQYQQSFQKIGTQQPSEFSKVNYPKSLKESGKYQYDKIKRSADKNIEQKSYSQPQQLKLKSKSEYAVNKIKLAQIKELLTFRMMAQRYPFKQLKLDIQKSAANQFSYTDICHMLVNEPFYLTVDYCRVLLVFMFEKSKPVHEDILSSTVLIAKLREIIKQFQLISEAQEQRIVIKCSNIITKNASKLKQVFQSKKDGKNSTIRLAKMQQILANFQFSSEDISSILGELSICSNSLEELNYDIIFERFNLESQNYEQVIMEIQNDDSFIRKSDHTRQKVSNIGNENQLVLSSKIEKKQKQMSSSLVKTKDKQKINSNQK